MPAVGAGSNPGNRGTVTETRPTELDPELGQKGNWGEMGGGGGKETRAKNCPPAAGEPAGVRGVMQNVPTRGRKPACQGHEEKCGAAQPCPTL